MVPHYPSAGISLPSSRQLGSTVIWQRYSEKENVRFGIMNEIAIILVAKVLVKLHFLSSHGVLQSMQSSNTAGLLRRG